MGFVDSVTYGFACKCGATESIKLVEYGSSYGSRWSDPKPMKNFEVKWARGFVPSIQSATCKKCGGTPTIT